MKILGIETTCDETSAAIVENGRRILSNVVASSLLAHTKYGGVVPEVAARDQIRSILPVINQAMTSAFKMADESFVDKIAIAHGPGLIGSLLVGVETAKTLAAAWDKPLIAVNHLIGHVYANWLNPISNFPFDSKLAQGEQFQISNLPQFPLVALIASGGHTDLILMTNHGQYQWLGGTLDDAAGEAFDKVARLFSLGYPGGPEIEKAASTWYQVPSNQALGTGYHLPRPMIKSGDYNFSFSGLKTAIVNIVNSSQFSVDRIPEIAYEFQKSIVDVLVTKTLSAAKQFAVSTIVVGGGVAANSELRTRMVGVGKENKIKVFFPEKELSTDNSAMIAAAAYFIGKKMDPVNIQSSPSLSL